MSAHSRSNPSLSTAVKPILIGVGVGVVCTTALLLLAALLFYKLSLPLGAVTTVSLIAAGIGSLIGGVAAGLCAKQQGWLMGAVCGTLLYLILLIAGLTRGGVAPAYAALKWAVLTVCSAAGGVWGVNRR